MRDPGLPLTLVHAAAPAPGRAIEVAPGVHWLRMPLPFALDHINLWLLDDDDGWTAIDTGVATDATRAAWTDAFEHVLAGRPIRRVLCTHMHPDHVGLAAWLCERFDAPLWMTLGEYAMARVSSAHLPGTDGAAQIAHFVKHGIDEAMRDALAARGAHFPSLAPRIPTAYRRIVDGERIRIGAHTWRVIVGRGHSPEHASLFCEALDVLISGDMLLPRISTNVSVWALEPDGDPLGMFLDSIAAFKTLPADVLVLPSHGLPFKGAHTRVDQLIAHHEARLAEVIDACRAQSRTAAEIVPVLFKRALDAHQMSFALGEALAHLHRARAIGALFRKPPDSLSGAQVARWTANNEASVRSARH